ncbi:MAG: glycoside hydrolase family 38 C-terminal domain-containing protein, partial [Hungatella sp.]
FYHHSKRIDFETVVDWKEQQLLLKVAFPVEICSDKAVYEVQFGNVERPTHKNTSWDEAKFEVCAHKWADLSECGYGVALLNNCKYGYDIHDSVMRLTLIKSGIFPNPDADKELHQFTYSCYPHLGDFREGNVIQEAYDLNCPLTAMPVTGHGNTHYSLIESDTNHVYIDTVKRAEDGNDLIIRMYEAYGKRGSFRLHIPAIMDKSAYECDCMEREQGLIAVKDDWLLCTIKPYEIKTIRIKINELEG